MIAEDKKITLNDLQIHLLWQRLTNEMADIFDAHGIYAAVAQETAVFAGVRTVAGVAGPQEQYYDVWICEPDGVMSQVRWEKGTSSFAALIENKRAMAQDKFTLPPTELIKSELWQLSRKSILSVPLPMGNSYQPTTRPGILCLLDPSANCPVNVDNIEPLATNITIFLDRAHLRRHVHKQDVEFAVVSDISFALASSLSLQKIYTELLEPVKNTLAVESISVGLIEFPSRDIVFVNALMGPLFSDMPAIRLKKGNGIAGWVAEHSEPVVINDAYSDRRFYSRVDNRSGFRTDSMICIPLQVEERVIGVMQAINKKSGEFHDNDLRLLQAIGGPLAAAIENAGLHEDVIAEKRRIETIFSSMGEGAVTVNADGLITHYNDALLSLLKIEDQELRGKKATAVLRLANADLEEFFTYARSVEHEYPQLAADLKQIDGTTAPVLISGAPIRDEKGNVNEIIFVFSDLRQIREVERMRDDFFHGIIHELRTPLATILMYARLLREGKAREKEKADRFLGVIERESDRLQKMVRQMLQLAKMESREFQRSPEPIELNSLFEEILPPLADRALEKGLTFHQRIQADLPPVMGDRETLYLAIKNLVENAVKFTLSGTVRIRARSIADEVVITVQDEGIGIPEQGMPNLFGRFFRAQTAVERGIAGTGLGLYMVKEGVEQYKGTIEVSSVENEGTTFTIIFPVADL